APSSRACATPTAPSTPEIPRARWRSWMSSTALRAERCAKSAPRCAPWRTASSRHRAPPIERAAFSEPTPEASTRSGCGPPASRDRRDGSRSLTQLGHRRHEGPAVGARHVGGGGVAEGAGGAAAPALQGARARDHTGVVAATAHRRHVGQACDGCRGLAGADRTLAPALQRAVLHHRAGVPLAGGDRGGAGCDRRGARHVIVVGGREAQLAVVVLAPALDAPALEQGAHVLVADGDVDGGATQIGGRFGDRRVAARSGAELPIAVRAPTLDPAIGQDDAGVLVARSDRDRLVRGLKLNGLWRLPLLDVPALDVGAARAGVHQSARFRVAAADRDHVGGDDGLVRRLALIAARPAVHGSRVEQHAAVVADRRELDDAGDLRLILEQELLRRGGEEPFAPALTGALRIRSAGKEPFGAMIHEGGPARPATARIRSTGSAHAGASSASG